MRVVLCVPVVAAALIGAAFSVDSSPAADCLTEPNRDAPAGQHWYYHLDRGTDRKCWYLHATVPAGAAETPAMELQSARAQRRAPPPAEPQRRQAVPPPAADLQRRVAAPQRPAPQNPAPQNPALRSEADEAALFSSSCAGRSRTAARSSAPLGTHVRHRRAVPATPMTVHGRAT